MIEFKCSECSKQLRAKDDAAGKQGKCPQCGKTLLVPEQETVTLEAIDSPSVPPPPQSSTGTGQIARRHRRWVAVLLVAAIIAIPIVPKFPLWLGIVLLVLCVLTFIPRARSVSQRLLRLNTEQKWSSGIRLAMYGLISLVLILVGIGGTGFKAEQDRLAAQKAAEEAERRQLASEANEIVISIAREAEAAWQRGELTLANQKLMDAENTPHATDLEPVRRLRARIANAEVQSLVAEAVDAAKGGDIETAKEKVAAALAVPHADALTEARKLDGAIGRATDSDRIRTALMELSDEAFNRLQESGEMPSQLISGYEGLDSRTADLAKAQLADVAAAREQRRQEELARARAEAKAARKAEEERKAREAAAAEAKRKEERKERIERGFSAWDGSHRGLTKIIKASMNDPKSYEHVETVYWDMDDHLVVKTTFRGKNAFGGVVPNWVKAKVDLDGNVLAIIEQGP